MRLIRPFLASLILSLLLGLPTGAVLKAEEAPGGQEQLKELYDNETLKKWYEEYVGLEKGSGPWMDLYKPPAMHMYWMPTRHYVRPDGTYYDQLLEKYKADE